MKGLFIALLSCLIIYCGGVGSNEEKKNFFGRNPSKSKISKSQENNLNSLSPELQGAASYQVPANLQGATSSVVPTDLQGATSSVVPANLPGATFQGLPELPPRNKQGVLHSPPLPVKKKRQFRVFNSDKIRNFFGFSGGEKKDTDNPVDETIRESHNELENDPTLDSDSAIYSCILKD
ncbi:hypothetical protein HMI55_001564 [Coelomomyces lativittatus]|nr:hypothetical protein HMI55_001564 [Coelomomyces lativittatus]